MYTSTHSGKQSFWTMNVMFFSFIPRSVQFLAEGNRTTCELKWNYGENNNSAKKPQMCFILKFFKTAIMKSRFRVIERGFLCSIMTCCSCTRWYLQWKCEKVAWEGVSKRLTGSVYIYTLICILRERCEYKRRFFSHVLFNFLLFCFIIFLYHFIWRKIIHSC